MVINAFFISVIIFAVYLIIKKIIKKKISIKRSLLEFTFIWYVFTLLEVTGIIGIHSMTQYKWEWFLESFDVIKIIIPQDGGEVAMLICNCVLFVPFGFLLPIIFQRMKIIRVLIISLIVILIIELLQAAGGRMLEVNDIVTNLLGTKEHASTSFLLCLPIFKICSKLKMLFKSYGILNVFFFN